MYRSAILGCGPRARSHAEVYAEIDNMELVACCDLDRERLSAFGEKFAITSRYTDFRQMVEAEKPDVLHLVTQPNFRLEAIQGAAEAGVAAIIVEKPLCLWPMEAAEISQVATSTGCKVVVNTQRRYFPQYPALRKLLQSGTLGEVEFVRAGTWGGPLAMGPHLMDLALMVLDDENPESVWASAEGLEGYEWSHAAPSHLMATYWLPGNRRIFYECSPRGLGNRGETRYWMHLDLDIWCTHGTAWAQQCGTWGYQVRGEARAVSAAADWDTQSVQGQRDFTAAVATWLDREDRPHECRLETALPVMWAIFAALKSARLGHQISLRPQTGFFLRASQPGRPIEVPAGVTDNDLKGLRNHLTR
jgi:predicted dehydrogenase